MTAAPGGKVDGVGADTMAVHLTEAVAHPAQLRMLPAPAVPPPGPLDGVVGLLLARAAPFDADTQAALRRQQGWGPAAPAPITKFRTHGRWLATPALGRLTSSSGPPASLTAALALLEQIAPCSAGDAAAALITARLADAVIHPGGVLNLARWYRVPTALRLVARGGGTTVVGAPDPVVGLALARLLTSAGRAGYVLLEQGNSDGRQERLLAWAIDADQRLRRARDLLVRVDDRASGLALHMSRMLFFSPRPLTLAELTAGLERNWRFRRRRIPAAAILAAWLDVQAWLVVSEGAVRIEGTLTTTQLAAVRGAGTDVLAEQALAGPATWAQLTSALTRSGVKEETARMAAMTNPVLVRTGPDEYNLRGAD